MRTLVLRREIDLDASLLNNWKTKVLYTKLTPLSTNQLPKTQINYQKLTPSLPYTGTILAEWT